MATYSNGSLANARVINAARSPQAILSIYLRFCVGVSYEKIELCKATIQEFVKERPREWVALTVFRAEHIEQEQGYVEYRLVIKHRESWQSFSTVQNSKSEVTSFSLEVAKQLGMRHVAPPLPVDLRMSGGGDGASASNSDLAVSPDMRELIQQQEHQQEQQQVSSK